jgi:hypothetical protein
MATWSVLLPDGTEDADTIHTIVQAAKTDIMDRLVASDGTIDTHVFTGTSATGKHVISETGFVKTHTTYVALLTFVGTNSPQDGTLHFVSATSTFYILRSGVPQLVASSDHGQFTNLTGNTAHTQYIATSGSRAMEGNLGMASASAITWNGIDEVTTGQPMAATHAAKSWYAAHGANSLIARHFGSASVPLSHCVTTIQSGSLTQVYYGHATIEHYAQNESVGIPLYTGFPGLTARSVWPYTWNSYIETYLWIKHDSTASIKTRLWGFQYYSGRDLAYNSTIYNKCSFGGQT